MNTAIEVQPGSERVMPGVLVGRAIAGKNSGERVRFTLMITPQAVTVELPVR